ncbi:MAG: hypothetical protein OEY52_03320 [Gammaproteobacteria bacterium]|nr:hypothetical protein [Gammaproteobacteria bacterium]
MDYLDQLDKMFDASYRLVTIETDDTHRVEDLIGQLSRFSNKAYYHSLPGKGMYRFGASHIEIPRTTTPAEILAHIAISRHFGVYVLQDFQAAFEDQHIVQDLKEIIQTGNDKVVVLLSEHIELPEALKPFALRSKHQLRDSA